MKQAVPRLAILLILMGVIATSGLTLLAGTPTAQDLSITSDDEAMTGSSAGRHWTACPWPPCMAPCAYPPEPQVVCKPRNGPAFVTSFACCCCGGSNGTRYRPL